MPLSTHRPAPVEEVIHGVVVRDPYRWLEDRTLPETEEWIVEQQKRCDDYFASCGDLTAIRTRVREYLDIEVVDQPAKVGDRYFYRRRDRGQEQACIRVRDIATGTERLLVDPSDQGPFASVGTHRLSEDGSLLAYETKQGGEDRKAICFVDVESGRILPDRIETGYARGLVFTPDNHGFFYCHETSTNTQEHRILFHLFHESVADQVVFRAARSRESRLVLTADSVHLGAIWIHQHGTDLIADFWTARRDEPTNWQQVFADKGLPFSPVLNYGRIFALSYVDAPNGRFVELSGDGRELRTIIPECSSTIRQVLFIADKIYACYLERCSPSVHCWDLYGCDLGVIDIPSDGTIQLMTNQSERVKSFFYTYESFAQAPMIFEYLPDSARSQIWHRRSLSFHQHPIRVQHLTYASSDGTQIPLTLVSEKNTDMTGNVPVVMTSYGGFGVPMTPQFSVLVAILLEAGAIFALPHIRGGGEFGEAWHETARGRNRQVSFDDFLLAAEWLCDQDITSPERLAIFGGSNSGLLVGAALTQRPDLFRAVLCIAPLLDMVRYEHFDQAVKWRHEYGTVDDPDDFQALHAYSPYHRVEENIDYPAVMFVSGDKDDRCNPAHVRKMAARLQGRNSQRSPVIVDYNQQRGHSPVLPLSTRVEALTRRIAFLCKELNIPLDAGGTHETICD